MKGVKDFVYGVQYYRAPTPTPKEWEKDIKQIKELGVNSLQLRVQWRWHEKEEGEFYFEDLDRLFDLAQKSNLKVVMKFMLETAPAWVFRKYNAERVDIWGRKIWPGAHAAYYVGGWWPCFENPGVRNSANNFIKALVLKYKDRENLLVWNLWNEPRSRPAGDCCCIHSKNRYRLWLKEKFGTIENLNQKYGKAWADFEEVDPPTMYADYVELHLWRQFMMAMIADRLAWMAGEVRKYDRKHPLMTHVGACSVIQDILCDSSDDWLNSREVDFYGSSFGVEGINSEVPFRADYYNDWIRSISPYYWIHEIYTGLPKWAVQPSPEEIRFRVWTSISRGAKGIYFWQYKKERFGVESAGFGLVNIDGSLTPRAEEVKKMGDSLAKYRETFRQFQPERAPIALLYDHHSDLISRLEQTTWQNFHVNFKDSTEGTIDYTYKQSLQGAYAAFWRLDLPVDFISSHRMEAIFNYKAAYLPYPILLTEEAAKILKEYVFKGGILISEASPGLYQENTWVSEIVPGAGLEVLFGLKEEERVLPGKVETLHLEKADFTVELPEVVLKTKISTAEVLGYWKSTRQPALTSNSYGKGKAILINTYPGLAYFKNRNEDILNFYSYLTEDLTGLKSPLKVKGKKGFVLSRLLKKGGRILVFLFNYEKENQNLLVEGLKLLETSDLIRKCMLEEKEAGISVNLGPYEISAFIAEEKPKSGDKNI